ncbi:MAG: Gfo/Idh/MocA family oxidoreductase [Verrucomicrobiales bacterium]|nr:Gfo/Idh/MocA family oxidoreductase [Verrucomicrobiales bacterium]
MKRRTALTSLATAPFLVSGEEKNTTKLKYLQIGTGHPHANKIAQYAESQSWEVVGIVEENPDLLERARKSKTYGKFKFVTLEEGLNIPGLTAVGIETEIRDLLKYAEIAVDAGFHVHIDKPAGSDLEHYRRILEKADQNKLVTQMGYMYRFNPAVQLLHRMLDAGWLGDVFETHAVMSKVMPPASRQYIDEFKGGTMFELGGHIIDLTVGVLGAPDKVTAFPRRVLDTAPDTLVDNMLAVFEYPKATATVRSTALEVEGFSRRHFTVCGTGGTFHIQPLDRPSIKVSLAEDHQFPGEERIFKKGHTEIQFGPYQRYAGDVEDFAEIIRGEKINPYPTDYDLAVQSAVLQASAM